MLLNDAIEFTEILIEVTEFIRSGCYLVDCFGTYKFNPIPIASVATIILHGFLGSLNLAA